MQIGEIPNAINMLKMEIAIFENNLVFISGKELISVFLFINALIRFFIDLFSNGINV